MSRLEREIDTIVANKEEELSVAEQVAQLKTWLVEKTEVIPGVKIPVWLLAVAVVVLFRKR